MGFLSVEELDKAVRWLERLASDAPDDNSLRINLAATRKLLEQAKDRHAAALADLAAMDGETL